MLQNHTKEEICHLRTQIDHSLDQIENLIGKVLGNQNHPLQNLGINDIEVHDRRDSAKKDKKLLKKTSSVFGQIDLNSIIYEQPQEDNKTERSIQQYTERNNQIVLPLEPCSPSQVIIQEPISLKRETRSNWIVKYLDYHDCSIYLNTENGNFQIIGVDQGIASCFNSKANEQVKIKSQDLYLQKKLDIVFDKHLQGFQLQLFSQGIPKMYELNVEKQMRVVIKVEENDQEMHQLLMLKVINQEGQMYEPTWGNYFQKELKEDVLLSPGQYLFTSLGNNQTNKAKILLEEPHSISFKVSPQINTTTRQILMATFPQCMTSLNGFYSDRTVGQQYARSVYMDLGLVIEVYQNIYPYEILFVDEDVVKEDISLLFSQLYNEKQIEGRLKRGQRVVKFYGIEKRPAALFVPRKQVVLGSYVMENKISHSVFK